MVEAAARRSRLIADGGHSEKERDAEGGGESGEGSSIVLYIVLGARQISGTGRRQTRSGRRSGGLGALACMRQLTPTQIAANTYVRLSKTGASYPW
jgi:hypothetical protein